MSDKIKPPIINRVRFAADDPLRYLHVGKSKRTDVDPKGDWIEPELTAEQIAAIKAETKIVDEADLQ